MSYDGYVVEIASLNDRSIRKRTDVLSDGSFSLHQVGNGDYLVRVLTLYDSEVTNTVITVGQVTAGEPWEIRLPERKLAKPPSGTVTVGELSHPLSRQVVKLLQNGQRLFDEQRFADAAARFREAVRDDPQSPQAHAQLGMALSRTEDWDDAIREYRQAVTLDSRNSILHSNLSSVLASAKRLDEAQSEAFAALQIDPANGRAHYILAAILVHQPGRLTEAVSHLVAARDSFPAARTALDKVCAVKAVQGCP
jgi:Flp pilus assembly protein TadD